MKKKIDCMTPVLIVLIAAAFLISLSSCKKSETGKKATPAAGHAATQTAQNQPGGTQAKPVPTAPTGAEATPKKEEVYSYNMIRSDGQPKRDPFTPIKMVIETPAQSFDVAQLGVNGVIIHGTKKANVVTPDCASLEVQVGDPIGIHDGTIVDITLDGVKVRETYIDVRGQIQEYERVIKNQPYSACK